MDLTSTNRNLTIKRHEHIKLIALSQIHARQIRIMEIEEEIARCNHDIECQKKVIEDADMNVNQQKAEIEREKNEALAVKETVKA
jgi:hypothetical protein